MKFYIKPKKLFKFYKNIINLSEKLNLKFHEKIERFEYISKTK